MKGVDIVKRLDSILLELNKLAEEAKMNKEHKTSFNDAIEKLEYYRKITNNCICPHCKEDIFKGA